jgi:hypothetical protein
MHHVHGEWFFNDTPFTENLEEPSECRHISQRQYNSKIYTALIKGHARHHTDIEYMFNWHQV